MILKTDYLGEVEVDESEIYIFEEGLYGFPDSKRYVFIGAITAEFPFLWMQPLDDEKAVFIVTNPFLFKEDYDFQLNEATTAALEIKGIEETLVYTMVVVPEEVKETTTNLKSPIILNVRNKQGRQAILNEEYPYKFKIFEKDGDR